MAGRYRLSPALNEDSTFRSVPCRRLTASDGSCDSFLTPFKNCFSGEASMPSNYLVVSSDGHAGPPAQVYRDYLDPAYREAFDAHQEAIAAGRMTNTSFVEEWDEETGDHELLAAYD